MCYSDRVSGGNIHTPNYFYSLQHDFPTKSQQETNTHRPLRIFAA